MNADTQPTERRGFFAKFFGKLKDRLRRMFGKSDDPNIYPFY